MKALAIARCVTVVGDPDQSSKFIVMFRMCSSLIRTVVYGWRSAEVGNLSRMQRGTYVMSKTCIPTISHCADYPGTQQILLEQNYRSTGAILKASERIVAQGDLETCCLPIMG